MAASDLPVFKLAVYHAEHEFSVKHLISVSDPESISVKELLDMADDECKALWDNLSLGYTESQGHPLLLREIAALYPGLTPDDVIEVVPNEGIYIALKVLTDLCKTGDASKRPHVVSTFPAYQSLVDIPKPFGCDISLWSVEEEGAAWTFDIKTLRSLLREETKMLIVNFPHNPTGYLPSDKDWEEIVNICKERNIFLFSDESYYMTNIDGSAPYPSACAMYDNAVTLFSLSKTFGLSGLRVGWLCTKNVEVMRGMSEFKRYLTICSSAPSEILGIIALRNKERLLERVLDILKTNLECLDKFFAEFPELFEWRKPRACTTGFLKLKGRALTLGSGKAEGFCQVLREKANILLVPSGMFDFPDEYCRVGYGRKNLPEIMPLFRDFLKTTLQDVDV